jgi:O-antigen/teichoic acid export membrane protein
VLVPVMTRLHVTDRGRELASIFRGTMWGTFALAGIAAAVIAAVAPLILGLSGHFYAAHALPLIVLAAASIPAALNNVLSSTSVSLGAMKEWLVSDLALAAVLLGTAAALVGSIGATGLAVAYLAGMVATDLVLALPLGRRLRASTLAT